MIGLAGFGVGGSGSLVVGRGELMTVAGVGFGSGLLVVEG